MNNTVLYKNYANIFGICKLHTQNVIKSILGNKDNMSKYKFTRQSLAETEF
jgi:hypothetical protein